MWKWYNALIYQSLLIIQLAAAIEDINGHLILHMRKPRFGLYKTQDVTLKALAQNQRKELTFSNSRTEGFHH